MDSQEGRDEAAGVTGERIVRPWQTCASQSMTKWVALAICVIGIGLGGSDVAYGDPARDTSGATARGSAEKAKSLRPFHFMRLIRGIERNLQMDPNAGDRFDMSFTRATLDKDRLIMNGRCNPRKPVLPAFKTRIETKTHSVQVLCYRNRKHVNPHHPGLGEDGKISFMKPLDKIAKRAALSANVSNAKVGIALTIVATRRKATVTFSRASSITGKSLKRLTLVAKGKRGVAVRKSWFPPLEIDSAVKSDLSSHAFASRNARSMRPFQFMKSIRSIERRRYMSPIIGNSSNLNYRKASLTFSKLTMLGRCNPKNPYTPAVKSYVDTRTTRIDTACKGNRRNVYQHPTYMGDSGVVSYSGPLEKIANKAATSRRIPRERVGRGKKIVANRVKAKVTYFRVESTTRRSLKSLIFRVKGKRGTLVKASWFPASVSP